MKKNWISHCKQVSYVSVVGLLSQYKVIFLGPVQVEASVNHDNKVLGENMEFYTIQPTHTKLNQNQIIKESTELTLETH